MLDDHVRLQLEIFVADLQIFEPILPDRLANNTNRRSEAERLEEFATRTFKIIAPNGEPLPAKLKLVEPRLRVDRQSPFAGMINPMTQQRVPSAPDDKRVLYAEIIYPFSGKPANLTIVPPSDEKGNTTTTIGFITYHKAVPVIDFRYLSSAAKLSLDWSDPWYSKFANINLKRHHQSALMSYLYVEPYEVRHEILTRVKDMENWMDLGLRGDEYIEVDELDGLRERIGEYLLTKNPLEIDGQSLQPILDRTNYIKLSVNGIQLLENPERLEISTAIVGVIITFLTDQLPQQVTVDWQLFSKQIQKVPSNTIDPAGPLPGYLMPDDNIQTWTNFLKKYTPPTYAKVSLKETVNELQIAWGLILAIFIFFILVILIVKKYHQGASVRNSIIVSLVVLITGITSFPYARIAITRPAVLIFELNEQETEQVLHSLLTGVYRAFDFREENDVYDKLALNVEGELLATLYLQNRQSFAVKQAGGAQARVKEVKIIEVTSAPHEGKSGQFVFNAKWTAMGSVGHWGHTHIRTNYYDAQLTVKAIEGNWKIIGLELLEERRLEPGEKVALLKSKGNNSD